MELKSTLGLNKTLEDIKKGKFSPVYLIYGDQNYLTQEAAQRIVEAVLPEKDREVNLEPPEVMGRIGTRLSSL